MKRPIAIACLVSFGLVGAAVAASPATAPMLAEIQHDYDVRHYSDVVKKVSTALQPRPDEPGSADRMKMLALKAESHLRLKQSALAADAFAAAAKEATDAKEIGMFKTVALLVRRSSPNGQYPHKRSPTDAKPELIDIVDADSRKSALVALFNDESKVTEAKIAQLEAESSLPALLSGIDQFRDLRQLEIAALGGGDASSRKMLSSLADRASQIMASALKAMTAKVQAVSRNANQNTSVSHTLNNDGIEQTVGNKRGVSAPGTELLNEVMVNCDQVVAACDTLLDSLRPTDDSAPVTTPRRRGNAGSSGSNNSADQFERMKAEATQLSVRIQEVLQGDYAAGTRRGGRGTQAPRN